MKLTESNFRKAIKELNSRALDLYLYLSKMQNEYGQIRNFKYAEAKAALNMPKSTYYFALQELADKNFVTLSQNEWGCEHILINDNIFNKGSQTKQRYLKVNKDYICGEEFVKLNVNVKRFILRMIDAGIFERNFVKLTSDKLKEYNVSEFIDVLETVFDIKAKDGSYIFTPGKLLILNSATNEKFERTKRDLKAYCDKLKMDLDYSNLSDVVKLVIKHRFNPYLHKALETIKSKGSIEPKLINMILTLKAGYAL